MSHTTKNLCPACLRAKGDLRPDEAISERGEVSLAWIQNAAEDGCKLCYFVKGMIEDDTTQAMDRNEHEDAMVRVEDGGMRFTGQWQGALVVEVYDAGKPQLSLHKIQIRMLGGNVTFSICCQGDKEWPRSGY
jgi:hypothetical protein